MAEGPLGYPFLYETHLPNFTESPLLRRQWHGLTAGFVGRRPVYY